MDEFLLDYEYKFTWIYASISILFIGAGVGTLSLGLSLVGIVYLILFGILTFRQVQRIKLTEEAKNNQNQIYYNRETIEVESINTLNETNK